MSLPRIRERSPIRARSSSCHKVATAIGLAPVNRDCAAYCDLRPTKGCFARRFFCKFSIFTTDSSMRRLASSSCRSTSSPRNRRSTTSRWRRRLPLELGGRTGLAAPSATPFTSPTTASPHPGRLKEHKTSQGQYKRPPVPRMDHPSPRGSSPIPAQRSGLASVLRKTSMTSRPRGARCLRLYWQRGGPLW